MPFSGPPSSAAPAVQPSSLPLSSKSLSAAAEGVLSQISSSLSVQPSSSDVPACANLVSVREEKSQVHPSLILPCPLMTENAPRQQALETGSGSISAPKSLSPLSILLPPIISSSSAFAGTPGCVIAGLSPSISSLVFSQPPQRRPLPPSHTPSNTPMPDAPVPNLSDTPFAVGSSRPGSVQTSQDWSLQSNSGQMPRSHQPSGSGPPRSGSNGIPEVNSPGASLKKASLTFAQRKEKVAKQLLFPGHSPFNVCENPKDHC